MTTSEHKAYTKTMTDDATTSFKSGSLKCDTGTAFTKNVEQEITTKLKSGPGACTYQRYSYNILGNLKHAVANEDEDGALKDYWIYHSNNIQLVFKKL